MKPCQIDITTDGNACSNQTRDLTSREQAFPQSEDRVNLQKGNLSRPLQWLEAEKFPFLPANFINEHNRRLIEAHEKLRNCDNQEQTGLILECRLNHTGCTEPIDLSFYGKSEILNVHGYGIPKFAHHLAKLLNEPSYQGLLADQYFTEFDQDSSRPKLVGIFQGFNQGSASSVKDAYGLISQLLIQCGAFPDINTKTHAPLRELFSLIEIPSQLGFMCGRGSLIKVIGQTSQPQAMQQFLETHFSSATEHSPGLIARLADHASHPEGMQPLSYSLDYDMKKQMFLPRLSIEVFPEPWHLGKKSAEALTILEWFCELSPEQRQRIREFHSYLPRGAREAHPEWAIDLGLTKKDRCTFLTLPSHLKLSFQRGRTTAKGYAYVMSDLRGSRNSHGHVNPPFNPSRP